MDDAMLVFTSLNQLERLWPELVAALSRLGLSVSLPKSRIMSCQQHVRMPPCIAGMQRVDTMIYLGVPLSLGGDDVPHVQSMCA